MSGTNICSSVYSDPALTFVDNGWSIFIPIVQDATARAFEQIDSINNFEIPYHSWDVSFDATGALSGFIRPVAPTLLPITMPPGVTVPDAPAVALAPIVLEAAPVEPAELANIPTLVLPSKPAPLDAARPGSAPALNLPEVPEAPTLGTVAAPVLDVIELPEVPDINVVAFAEEAPEFDAPIPSEQINFLETPYTSELLTRVKDQVTAMIDGTYYLPTSVAQALWDQAVSREDQSSLKLAQDVRDEFATRGFDEPTGNLAKRLRLVAQQNRNKRSELSRDVYIRTEEVALENLRFAVQRGMELEANLLQAHLAVEQRKFELAVKMKDLAIAIFQAHVSRYNAVIQAYNARVDAYRAFLDGLRAQVDIYKAQVDAARAKGELNEHRVRAYAEQIRAQLAYAEIYRAQVEGAKAAMDAERAKIEGYRAEVEAFDSLVRAHGQEWEAYRTQIMAQVEQGKMYETLGRVHGQRVDVWRTKSQGLFAKQQADLAGVDAFLRQHDNQLRAIEAKLSAARTQITAEAAQNDALARMYEASARVEGTAVEADTRAFQAETERSRVRSELMLADAAQFAQQLRERGSLALRALESASQATSQVASSAYSALNFSASVGSNQSRSKACSTSFIYTGEIADAGA